MLAAFHPIDWFLERAAGEGIPLTSAGYLKPADVIAASEVVPAMGNWIGAKNREVQCAPLLDFRESLQGVGLLRKQKGRLHLTRAGGAARRHPEELWNHLADRLGKVAPRDFNATAGLMVLAYAAVSPDGEFPLAEVTSTLSALGWRTQGAPGVTAVAVSCVPTLNLLSNIATGPRSRQQRHPISPTASALARAALR